MAQLDVIDGHTYHEVRLAFFRSPRDARTALGTWFSLYGGRVIGNVVIGWIGSPAPTGLRELVVRCLMAASPTKGGGVPEPPPVATLATFVGMWGGHSRGLAITEQGGGAEGVNSGCCSPIYDLEFKILSVRGTLTRATAVYRVTSFAGHDARFPDIPVGRTGELRLRNGILTNALTRVSFCSAPAWVSTNGCGA